MKRYNLLRALISITLQLFCYSVSAQVSRQNIQTSSAEFAWLERMLSDTCTKYNIPGITIGVVKDGRVIYSGAVGWADRKRKTPASTRTAYQIGSLTKTFTGNILAQIIHAKLIGLEDTISKHFPPNVIFPLDSVQRAITIKDIATHSSGLPRYPENLQRIDPEPMKGYSKEQLYRAISSCNLEFPIGSRYSYSNFGYGILGVCMENVTKQSYTQLLEKYIFRPLAMHNSSGELSSVVQKNLATPYFDDTPEIETKPWIMGALTAHGGIFSTVEDLCKFIVYQMSCTDSPCQMQQTIYYKINPRTGYGLGIFITQLNSPKQTRVLYHGGDLDSYASNYVLYPDKKLGLIMLSNGTSGRAWGQLCHTIEEELYKRYADTQ